MKAEWNEVQLVELCAPERLITYGIVKVGDFVSGGVPVIRGGDIRENRIVFDDEKRVSRKVSESFRRTILRGGEILINLIAEPGHTAIVGPEFSGSNVSRDVAVIPLNDSVDHRYVNLVLRSPTTIRWLSARLQGSVTQKINLSTLREVPIPVPPLDEQRRIAGVLGALDDKIELNRKMNRTLEEMAQAIFKSWFIDFDGVPPEDLVDSELGPIPTGFSVGCLDNVLVFLDGRRVPLSKKQRAARPGPYPYYGATSVMDHVDDFLFEGEHVLLGEDGSVVKEDGSPFVQYVWDKFWVNNHAHVLRPRPPLSTEHLLFLTRNLNVAPYVTGAVQAKLSQRNLKAIPVALPPASLCEAFGRSVAPLMDRWRANHEQANTLSELRDALLPKLVSGEIRVPEADEQVEAAS